MDDNTKPTDEDFQSALADEFGLAPPTEETSTPPSPTSDDDDKTEPPADEEKVDKLDEEEGEPSDSQEGETTEEAATRKAEDDAKNSTEDTPKFATKDDVVDALRQYNEETTGRVTRVKEATNQVVETLYPEGIDQNIYDTNGQVIKTAQDIVDRGLVNSSTNEPFTYEEAASFMLQSQQQMAKNIEELNDWAETVAEKNISLIESNNRVIHKWGDTLKAMPEVADSLAQKYIETQLKFDDTNSYIVEMTMTPDDFYDAVMAPYTQLNRQYQLQAEQKAAEQATQAQNEQAERAGLPPQRGSSEVASNTGDLMLDALIDEMKKG